MQIDPSVKTLLFRNGMFAHRHTLATFILIHAGYADISGLELLWRSRVLWF